MIESKLKNLLIPRALKTFPLDNCVELFVYNGDESDLSRTEASSAHSKNLGKKRIESWEEINRMFRYGIQIGMASIRDRHRGAAFAIGTLFAPSPTNTHSSVPRPYSLSVNRMKSSLLSKSQGNRLKPVTPRFRNLGAVAAEAVSIALQMCPARGEP